MFVQPMFIIFQEPDESLYKAALESLRTLIRASTTSMTSVPKPLKFLRIHYDTLKQVHEKITNQEVKVSEKKQLQILFFVLAGF